MCVYYLCINSRHPTLALPYFSAWIGIKPLLKFGTCEMFGIIMSRKLNVEIDVNLGFKNRKITTII